MTRAEVVRPYVEKVLSAHLGLEHLIADKDGDYPVQHGSALYYVRILDERPPVVRVFSWMLHDVELSPELLTALNEINMSTSFVRLFWAQGDVVVATELLAETLDPEELAKACDTVGDVADRNDSRLKERFGGNIQFEEPAVGEDEPIDV